MTRVVVVLLLVLSGSIAFAQAPGETPILTPSLRAPHKEPGTAVLLSVGTPVVGFLAFVGGIKHESAPVALLGLAGMYLGPSTGQWYAGRVGGIGLATRAVAAVAIVHGIGLIEDTEGNDCLGFSSDAECARAEAEWKHQEDVGGAYLWTGLALWGGSTIFDVVMAYRATNDWNREHALALTPTLLPATGGRAPGLTLSMTF
jgi:hypothetical protein